MLAYWMALNLERGWAFEMVRKRALGLLVVPLEPVTALKLVDHSTELDPKLLVIL